MSHLFFADDNILFGHVTREGIEAIKSMVNEYEQMSGQLVNFKKSLIYFSSNVVGSSKIQLGEILGVQIANNPEKYLGLPIMISRCKKIAFLEIKENF